MKNRAAAIGAVVAAGAAIVWIANKGRATDKPAAPNAIERKEVVLTVYKDDFGMVRELRPVVMVKGNNQLRVQDVSKLLDPQSVLLGWQDKNNAAQITAHAYDLGVANGDGLLKRYLGKEVEIVRYGMDGREAERTKGTLMVNSGNQVVLESDGKFIVNPQGTIVAASTPDIIPLPQLSVQADSPAAANAALDVAYLTRGLSWSADYVATLAPDADTLNLECWATVTNRTGADYPNAKVTLVAGSPNRAAVPGARRQEPMYYARASSDYKAKSLVRDGEARKMVGDAQNMGEFHEYPVKSATTVVQEQMNRLLMLSSTRVSVVRDYNTRPANLSGYDEWDGGWSNGGRNPERGSVAVALTFHNREEDGLGQPLPSGAIRLYEPDTSGTLRYAGAANLMDTPRDQSVYLTLATAFDVFTEGRIIKKQRVGKHTLRKQIELALHNEKQKDIDLRIVQGFYGRWKIVSESGKHSNLDSDTAQWKIHLAAHSTTPLRFTVEFVI